MHICASIYQFGPLDQHTTVMAVERCSTNPPPRLINGSGTLSAAILCTVHVVLFSPCAVVWGVSDWPFFYP